MLEEIMDAVEYARVCHILRELRECRPSDAWDRRTDEKPVDTPSRPLREILGLPDEGVRETAILPSADGPVSVSTGLLPQAEQFIVTYSTGRPQEHLTYVIRSSRYRRVARYDVPKTNIFYVHVPPWASIRDADELEMGSGVLGTAQPGTGQIRLLHSLDPIQRAEVLLHETLHLLYPMHAEKQIRDMVRSVIGKQYCCFH